MKKIAIVLFALATVIYSCGGDDTKKSETKAGETTKEEPKTPDAPANPDYDKGLALVGASDCFTCHKIDEKLTGPSYKEVAAKYPNADEATINGLVQKIIKGSNGVWGDAAMTPHATLPEEDAKAMVKYILLLK